jgi:hypothetical protein
MRNALLEKFKCPALLGGANNLWYNNNYEKVADYILIIASKLYGFFTGNPC